MVKQRIDGDGNVQVGKLEGDVIVDRLAPIMREDDPDVVHCPFNCGQLTWWNAPKCWNCGRPVLAYFEQQARQARKDAMNKRAALFGLAGAILIWGGSYLPSAISGMAIGAGAIAIIGFFICGTVADKM